ncbi:MAG: hypothetical protein K5663_10845 [Clostridiales bacterium]|nr:hypothetical protein [Clostridiales bacterium]
MGYVKDELMYNYSGYYDPTAGIALRNISRVQPSGYVAWAGQPIYICPAKPVQNDRDIAHLEECCRFALKQGAQPLAPLLFYAGIVDITDPDQQRMVLSWTRAWIRHASEIWIFDGEPPASMKSELVRSVRKGKTIRYFGKDSNGDYTMIRKIGGINPHRERTATEGKGK